MISLYAEADSRSPGRRGQPERAEAGARGGRPHHAGDRRRDRRRNLLVNRNGGRRARFAAAAYVVRYGAGPALVFSFLLLGVVCGLAALCYAELARDDSAGGKRVRVLVRDARRDRRLDHRLGSHSRVRRRKRCGRHSVGRLFQCRSSTGSDRATGLVDDGYRTALLSSDPAVHGLLETAPRLCRHADSHQRASVRDRDGDHVASAAGRDAKARVPTTSWSW